jgi:excisionase family DNA binding protein
MSTPAVREPQALTIADAARRLGVHRETLRAAIERGEVPAARLGRRWLVPVAALDRLLAGLSSNRTTERP